MEGSDQEVDIDRFLEVYSALRDVDKGVVGQFEHTVYVTEGGPEILTVE